MCQCMICNCWWYNYCGVCCGGVHAAELVCSYWLCKPPDLMAIDPECCHLCACDGLGYNCLYYGSICCAPESVRQWSAIRSGGGMPVNTIIINNSAPIYTQPSPGYGNQSVTVGINQGYPGGGVNVQLNPVGGGNMNQGYNNNNQNFNNSNPNANNNYNPNVKAPNSNYPTNNQNMNMNANFNGNPNYNANFNGNPNYNANNASYNANFSSGASDMNTNVGMNTNNQGMNAGVAMNLNSPGMNAKVSF